MQIEDLVRQRILDEAWDDVERKVRLIDMHTTGHTHAHFTPASLLLHACLSF